LDRVLGWSDSDAHVVRMEFAILVTLIAVIFVQRNVELSE
jgi:hypothetical protein